EDIAIKEANKLRIPVFAIVDTNSDPSGVDYIVPGNDDALRAIDLYCDLFADTVLDGLKAEMASAGIDTGADLKAKGKAAAPAAEAASEDEAPAKQAASA